MFTCLQPDEQVLIIDAGGGTIDISTYKVLSDQPLKVEELYEPQCESNRHNYGCFLRPITLVLGLGQGAEFVTARATAMAEGSFSRPLISRLPNPA